MVCNMYVVDPSITVEEGEPLPPQLELLRNGVEVLMFSPDASAFPRLQNPGDFIRFHRVEVRSSDPGLLCCFPCLAAPCGQQMERLSF